MTNVLVEGGSRLLGSLFDARAIDEVHVFLAPKLCGGGSAASPIAGNGIERIAEALRVEDLELRQRWPRSVRFGPHSLARRASQGIGLRFPSLANVMHRLALIVGWHAALAAKCA